MKKLTKKTAFLFIFLLISFLLALTAFGVFKKIKKNQQPIALSKQDKYSAFVLEAYEDK